MNLIILNNNDFCSDHMVRLTGRRLDHVGKIIKARPGDTLQVGLLNGNIGTGKITAITNRFLELDVHLKTPPPPPMPVTLILALHRPIVLKRVLLSVASLGVKRIILLHSRKVEKSFWNSTLLKGNNLEQQLLLGLEQGFDTVMPQIMIKKRFKPFVEDELPQISKGTKNFIAHPLAGSASCPASIKAPATLAIGPEGGFVDYEIEHFQKAGFQPVHLGQRILRVETAVVSMLAKLFL